MRHFTFLIFLITFFSKLGITQEFRLIYNCDGTDLLGNKIFNKRPLTRNDVNFYVDMYANTQVTTFMVCSGSDYFHYRSKYGRVIFDDCNGRLDCGEDTALLRNNIRYYKNHLNLENEGTDIIEASLQRAKERGMETLITYRMNDLHFNDTTIKCPISYPDFWFSHPEYWLNEEIGWHSAGAFDFKYKEVRKRKLDIITEQLEKYGEIIDGFDLDFMRFIVYFKEDEAVRNAPLMTELVMEIRKKIDETSNKYNKKILLSARVPIDVEHCLQKGLDVREWARLGLIDFFSIGVHWKGNPAIPVRKFKNDLAVSNVPVYATIDDGAFTPREKYSHGMYRGMASHILAKGGDGIHLFNFFFDDYMAKYNQELHLEREEQVCRVAFPGLLNELGSLGTLKNRNKIYALDDGSSSAYGLEAKTPLPLKLNPGSISSASIFIGDDPEKTPPVESVLFISISKMADVNVSVNDQRLLTQQPDYVGLYDRDRGVENEKQVYAFVLPEFLLRHGANLIEISSNTKDVKVDRLEIALKYGSVTTNGYF